MEHKEDAECFVWRDAQEEDVGFVWRFQRNRACKPLLEAILKERHQRKRNEETSKPEWLDGSGKNQFDGLSAGVGWPWPGCGIYVPNEAIPQLVSLMVLWLKTPEGRERHGKLVAWINAAYKAVGMEREVAGGCWLEELESVQKGLRRSSHDLLFCKFVALWHFAARKVLGDWGSQLVSISCFYYGAWACLEEPLPKLTPRKLRNMRSKAERGLYKMMPTFRDKKPAIPIKEMILIMVKDIENSSAKTIESEAAATECRLASFHGSPRFELTLQRQEMDELTRTIMNMQFIPDDPKGNHPHAATVLKDATQEVCDMFHSWMCLPSSKQLHQRLVERVNKEYKIHGIQGNASGGYFLKEIEKIMISICLACFNGTSLDYPRRRLMACAAAATDVLSLQGWLAPIDVLRQGWPGLQFIELCKLYLLTGTSDPMPGRDHSVEVSKAVVHCAWGWYGSKFVDEAGHVQQVNLNDAIGRVAMELEARLSLNKGYPSES